MGKYADFSLFVGSMSLLAQWGALAAGADPLPVVPSPREVAVAALIAESKGPHNDLFRGIPAEDRPPARFVFQPMLTGMYNPGSPFVSQDGVIRPAAVGGLMIFNSKDGTPVAQIDGVTYPGLNSNYGLITIKDKFIANGKVFTGGDYYLVSHEQRLRIYRRNLNSWAVLEGYNWAHFVSGGTVQFDVMDTQMGSGFGIGVSFRPNERAAKRGALFQMSLSGGPAARFGTEFDRPVRAAGAGFFNLTAVY